MQEINWNNFQQDLIDRNQKIEKAWETDLEKGRSGIYKDTYQNRKLNRVGQEYGKDKKEDKNLDSERSYMVNRLIEQSKKDIHPLAKLTKEELSKLSEKVKSNWSSFWKEGGKNIYDSRGKNIDEKIVQKYPLEVWTVLRSSMELGGLGLTDTSYLKRNNNRSDKMKDIENRYNIKKEYANIITSRDINAYHERLVRDEVLAGRKVSNEVLKDYPEIKKMQEKILKDYPELK